jgi:rfaE bifunctional protein nucleotidyltransferase chain/domain
MSPSSCHPLPNPKLHSLAAAVQQRQAARQAKQRWVLTNGCFDLLHTGHLYYLQQAAGLGDQLWVALNSTTSVRALKGPSRPIQSDDERAYALAALDCVRGIVVFDTPRLHDEILALQPDVYVKAGDYTLESLHPLERQALDAVGASIHFLPFLPGYSTTALIERLRHLPAALA